MVGSLHHWYELLGLHELVGLKFCFMADIHHCHGQMGMDLNQMLSAENPTDDTSSEIFGNLLQSLQDVFLTHCEYERYEGDTPHKRWKCLAAR